MQRGLVGSAVLALVSVFAAGCADSSAPAESPATDTIVSGRFELRWQLDGADLLLSVDTDLPDEGELSVSVSRSYYEVGNDTEYRRDYLSVFEPISEWREPRRVPLDAGAWRDNLAAFQSDMAEIAAAERDAGVPADETVAFEVDSIADEVRIRAVTAHEPGRSAVRRAGQPKPIGSCHLLKAAWGQS